MTEAKSTINELLVDLFNYILFIEERNLKKQGIRLSMSEVHLLDNIRKASDNTMSAIARQCMITQGTLSTNVRRLADKGYVDRFKDEKDARVTHLVLTDKAKPVLEIHDNFHHEMIDQVMSDLNLEEDLVLQNSLKRIMQYFKEQYAE